jgi:hypothetical protein
MGVTRMSKVLLQGPLVCALILTAQSCCTKNKCASTIELTVLNRDGTLMTQADGVTVEGSAKAFPCDEYVPCSFRIGNAGDFTVSAEGYKPALLRVDIERDDCDNTLSQSIEVRMVPAEDSAQPTIQRSVRDAC